MLQQDIFAFWAETEESISTGELRALYSVDTVTSSGNSVWLHTANSPRCYVNKTLSLHQRNCSGKRVPWLPEAIPIQIRTIIWRKSIGVYVSYRTVRMWPAARMASANRTRNAEWWFVQQNLCYISVKILARICSYNCASQSFVMRLMNFNDGIRTV
jgi:hypothetical protein